MIEIIFGKRFPHPDNLSWRISYEYISGWLEPTKEFLLLIQLSLSRSSSMFKEFSLVCTVVGSFLTRTKGKLTKMIIRCHSLLFIVILCHSLSFFVVIVVTRFTTCYHSFSFLVIPCYTLYLSLSLVVAQRITRLLFCKRSKNKGLCRKKLNTNYIESSYPFAIQKFQKTCFQKSCNLI